MAQQVTATLGCKEQNPNSVIERAQAVLRGLNLNARYLTPNPALATVSAALAIAVAARKDWNNGSGSSTDHVKLKSATKILFDLIEQLCNYVNNTTAHDEVALSTTGFPLSNVKHKLPLMNPPRNVRRLLMRNLGMEKVKIYCKKPGNASKHQKIIYKFYRSTTTIFTDAILVATETKTTFTDAPEVATATAFYYWVTAVTPAGESEPSDVCHVVVIPLSM